MYSCNCTWSHDAVDSLNLYLCSRVEDCWEEIHQEKSCMKKFSEFFMSSAPWNFITQHRSNKWHQHSVIICYSCIAATLNGRKEFTMCCKKGTIENFHSLLSSVTNLLIFGSLYFFRLWNVMIATELEFL